MGAHREEAEPMNEGNGEAVAAQMFVLSPIIGSGPKRSSLPTPIPLSTTSPIETLRDKEITVACGALPR